VFFGEWCVLGSRAESFERIMAFAQWLCCFARTLRAPPELAALWDWAEKHGAVH